MRIIILSLTSLIISLPFFLSSSLIGSPDIFFYVAWSEQFHNALMEGVLYPRWVDTPFGYGSPTFIFYAPLSFYIISMIHILIHSHLVSLKIAIYLSFFLSGLSMYAFARKLNGEYAGLLTGILYQVYPFHVGDLFMRGSIPALFAYVWFPLVLLFIREIFIKKSFSSMGYMSLAYAGLIMTHLVSSYMFTFVMIGYGLYMFFIEKKKGILRLICAMILGLGLSSAYFIPVIFERSFIHIEFIKVYNYRDGFLFLYNIYIREGFYRFLNTAVITDAVFLVFFLTLLKRKYIEARNTFFVVLISVSVFLTTPLSLLIWKYIPYFSTIQFPWRWLIFSGLSVTIIAGSHIVNMQGKVKKDALLILLPFLMCSFASILSVSFINLDICRISSKIFAPCEYRPIWVKNYKNELPDALEVEIIKGEGSEEILDWKSNKRVLSTNGITPLYLKFSTFYYPGWECKIDDRQCGIMIDKDSGSMVIEVPEGRHIIELFFRDTPPRYYGKLISIVSLFIIAFICLFEINRLNKNKSWGAR